MRERKRVFLKFRFFRWNKQRPNESLVPMRFAIAGREESQVYTLDKDVLKVEDKSKYSSYCRIDKTGVGEGRL
jgi:hypothetical protein